MLNDMNKAEQILWARESSMGGEAYADHMVTVIRLESQRIEGTISRGEFKRAMRETERAVAPALKVMREVAMSNPEAWRKKVDALMGPTDWMTPAQKKLCGAGS